MLDDVERRRFLVEPAREDPVPAPVRLLDVDLDERASQLFLLPWRRRLARAKANDHVLPAHRLTRVKGNRLDDAVALVEHSQHRDTLRHWRDSALAVRGRGGLLGPRQRRVLAFLALAARDERKRGQQRSGERAHAYSGIQGS
jgi:hypothetical protein